MENNNRQGCRWVKASEKDFDSNIGDKHWRANGKAVSAGMAFVLFKKKTGDDIEVLEESIEPCATSSEKAELEKDVSNGLNVIEEYSMQNHRQSDRIIELENGVKNFIEWLKEKRPTITGTGAPKLILESLLEGRETFVTPSPTGDRDCEELKKEVERLTKIIGKDIERHLSEEDKDELVAWLTTFDNWTKIEAFRFVEKMGKVFDIKKK